MPPHRSDANPPRHGRPSRRIAEQNVAAMLEAIAAVIADEGSVDDRLQHMSHQRHAPQHGHEDGLSSHEYDDDRSDHDPHFNAYEPRSARKQPLGEGKNEQHEGDDAMRDGKTADRNDAGVEDKAIQPTIIP